MKGKIDWGQSTAEGTWRCESSEVEVSVGTKNCRRERSTGAREKRQETILKRSRTKMHIIEGGSGVDDSTGVEKCLKKFFLGLRLHQWVECLPSLRVVLGSTLSTI